MKPRLRPTCCWIFRFQDCTSAFLKLGLITAGEIVVGVPLNDAANPLIGVATFTVIGKAKGGFAFKAVTKPVSGWSTWNAYPPRKTVLPLCMRSQANPTRGWKFLSFWE